MSECKYWGFYVCCSNFGNQEERGSKNEPHAVSQVPQVCSNTNMVRKTKRRSNNPPMHIDIHGTVCTCSTLWENRGDYWEISDVPLQITLMNISQHSTLFRCASYCVRKCTCFDRHFFPCAVKFVQTAATRRNNFEHF